MEGAVAIVIKADNVSLDLGGHTITAMGPGFCPTDAIITIDHVLGGKGLEIFHGKLMRGPSACSGIMSPLGAGVRGIEIRLRDIETNAGFGLVGLKSAEIVNCRIHDAPVGINLDGNGYGLFTAMVANNIVERVEDSGLVLVDLQGGIVRGNIVKNSPSRVPNPAVWIGGNGPGLTAGYNLITGNTITGATSNNSYGILVNSSHNVFRENVVSNHPGVGIQIHSGRYNHFENNQIQGNGGCGLRIPNAGGNSFRGNVGGDNGQAGSGCISPGNADLGGNFGL